MLSLLFYPTLLPLDVVSWTSQIHLSFSRFSRSGGCSAGQPQHSGLVPTSWGQALAGEDSENPWVHSDGDGEVIEGSLEDSMDRLMNGGYIEIPD